MRELFRRYNTPTYDALKAAWVSATKRNREAFAWTFGTEINAAIPDPDARSCLESQGHYGPDGKFIGNDDTLSILTTLPLIGGVVAVDWDPGPYSDLRAITIGSEDADGTAVVRLMQYQDGTLQKEGASDDWYFRILSWAYRQDPSYVTRSGAL